MKSHAQELQFEAGVSEEQVEQELFCSHFNINLESLWEISFEGRSWLTIQTILNHLPLFVFHLQVLQRHIWTFAQTVI